MAPITYLQQNMWLAWMLFFLWATFNVGLLFILGNIFLSAFKKIKKILREG